MLPPCHNGTNQWQGRFRLGWFDAVAARYALQATGGVDILAVTNLDRMSGLAHLKVATRYQNADPRFFSPSGEEMYVPQTHDLEWLRARTEAMYNIVPEYTELPGWTSASGNYGVRPYLDALAGFLDHPIHAYSVSPTKDGKTYLPAPTAVQSCSVPLTT